MSCGNIAGSNHDDEISGLGPYLKTENSTRVYTIKCLIIGVVGVGGIEMATFLRVFSLLVDSGSIPFNSGGSKMKHKYLNLIYCRPF